MLVQELSIVHPEIAPQRYYGHFLGFIDISAFMLSISHVFCHSVQSWLSPGPSGGIERDCLLSAGPVHLKIITGQGHHSIDNTPKIWPAMKQFLEQRGLEYREFLGYFVVPLNSSEEA